MSITRSNSKDVYKLIIPVCLCNNCLDLMYHLVSNSYIISAKDNDRTTARMVKGSQVINYTINSNLILLQFVSLLY
jgi:hypothetical protein